MTDTKKWSKVTVLNFQGKVLFYSKMGVNAAFWVQNNM